MTEIVVGQKYRVISLNWSGGASSHNTAIAVGDVVRVVDPVDKDGDVYAYSLDELSGRYFFPSSLEPIEEPTSSVESYPLAILKNEREALAEMLAELDSAIEALP